MGMIPEEFVKDAIAIRKRLHQIPELKYEERKTSGYIAEILKSYGYEVQKMAKTGLVALLDSGKPGKTIAFRADIDGLPIVEETGASYQSEHQGTMHACGHDGHSATLLLVARILQEIRSELKGKIKLIFQPAEEGGKGSSLMIEEGVLKKPSVDAIFAYHNWPGLPLNTVATRVGSVLAGSGRFEIKIPGKRGHLSQPNEGTNPVIIGANIVKGIAALSFPRTVINVLGFNSGDWKLGTSTLAEIVACYFAEGEKEIALLKKEIQAIVKSNGSCEFHEFQYPTVNTSLEAELVFSAAKKCGIENIERMTKCEMAGEDFSEYLKIVPGCYFFIGAGKTPPLHTAHYDFPDEILPIGAKLMVEIAKQA